MKNTNCSAKLFSRNSSEPRLSSFAFQPKIYILSSDAIYRFPATLLRGTLRMANQERRSHNRRSDKERRSGVDTRSESERQLVGERRSLKDRRTGTDRRAVGQSHVQQSKP